MEPTHALRRLLGRLLAALLLGLSLVLVPVPAHAATPAVWDITVVEQKGYSGPTGYVTFQPTCPSGQVPLTGGYSGGSDVRRISETFQHFAGGKYILSLYEDDADYPQITAWVWCVPDSYFSGGHLVAQSFTVGANHIASGTVGCAAGEKALNASVTFGGVESTLLTTYPNGGLGSWFVRGWNQAIGSSMVVSVWCVSDADFSAMRTYSGSNAVGWGAAAQADCPGGMQPIAGGTYATTDVGAISVRSYPARGTTYHSEYVGTPSWYQGGWRSTTLSLGSGSMITNVMCVPATIPQFGQPTATPTPTPDGTSARWTWNAADPAAAGGYTMSQTCSTYSAAQGVVPRGPCASALQLDGLADGSYYLTVTATTTDGRSKQLQLPSITIDTTGPVLGMSTPLSATHDPSLGFTVQDATNVETLTCAVDAASPAACGEGYQEGFCDPELSICFPSYYDYRGNQQIALSGIADGLHALHVTATDERGNPTTSHLSFRVDTTAPSVTQTAPSVPFTLATSVAVRWTASDAGAGLAATAVSSRGAKYNGDWSPLVEAAAQPGSAVSRTYTGLARGATYCFSVRVTDAAAWSRSTTQRCTAVPLDDRDLAASTGWKAVGRTGWFTGTTRRTTRLGASLSVTGATAKRVGLVALACPTCGKVGVYVAGTRVGVVDLRSSTSRRRTVVLPAFSQRTGTVTLKVLTSGRTVEVDALGISRS